MSQLVNKFDNNRPAFLFDCDGVILRWFSRLIDFLEEKGLPTKHLEGMLTDQAFLEPTFIFSNENMDEAMALMREYNQSNYVANLLPLSDKVSEVLNEIAEHGYLILVSCVGTTKQTFVNRITNLEKVCGGELFAEYHLLDVNESKEQVIKSIAENYNVAFFVDDRLRHVAEAQRAGVRALHFNSGPESEQGLIEEVKSWDRIQEVAREYY